MKIKSIKNYKKLKGARVIVRADFNVPIKNRRVSDDYKIIQTLPTIKFLIQAGARVLLLSHLGRPLRRDLNLSLAPVKNILEKNLNKKIKLIDLQNFSRATKEIDNLENGGVIMAENIRFYAGEKNNDADFTRQLAGLGDIFVLDGFGVAHRAAPSVTGLTEYLPSFAGLLLMEEIAGLSKILRPKKPLVVVIGGAKISTKLPLIKNFLPRAKYILIGGGLANTYFWARGKKVGGSLLDKTCRTEALYYGRNKKIIWPVDFVVGDIKGKNARVVTVEELKIMDKRQAIFDIGPATIRKFAPLIKQGRTLVWNGAMGYFEGRPYQYGTHSVARLFAARAKGPAFGVTGGGETQEVIKKLHLANDVDLVSTGGGAMLEFLSGAKMPGLLALQKQPIFKKKK